MNSINLTGRITRDLEIRYTNNNKAVCEFSLAVNRIGQEQADFINCVVWEKQAENLTKYQGKGSLIAVAGSLRTDQWEDEEGKKRYKTYVLANNIEYLGSKPEQKNVAEESNDDTSDDPFENFGDEIELTDNDLPF